jgi:uncharacterized ubiquitin-like protein YukD
LKGGSGLGIIVTIVTPADERHERDYELPAHVPVRELIPLIVNAMGMEEPRTDEDEYILEVKWDDRPWIRLDEAKSLEESEIADGAFLRVRKVTSHSRPSSPVLGWRPII